MGKRSAAAAIAFILIAFFCATEAFAGYGFELSRATRKERVFNFETWDANIIWYATFFSDRFRDAFDERHIQINYLEPEDAAVFLNDEKYKQEKSWEFFIVFYTKKEYKKFTNDPDSFWKIYIETASGERVKPESIEPINLSPYEYAMYRHLNRWSKGYRVLFPKADLGSEFKLTIESIVGRSTLKWKTEDEPAKGQNIFRKRRW